MLCLSETLPTRILCAQLSREAGASVQTPLPWIDQPDLEHALFVSGLGLPSRHPHVVTLVFEERGMTGTTMRLWSNYTAYTIRSSRQKWSIDSTGLYKTIF